MKIFLKILLGFCILIIIAVAGFVFTFNPNDYKDDIVNLVKEKTGRTLSIPGDISLSLFPWIGLELGKLSVSNANGFPQPHFAKIESLQVRAKLLPLLKKELEADTMVIDGLTLNLAKNKKGISNWQDLTGKETNAAPKAAATEAKPEKLLAVFALNGIKIKNAQLNWQDEQNKQKLSVNKFQLSIGKLRPDTRVPVNMAFHFVDASTNAQVSLITDLSFTTDFNKLVLHDTALNTKIKLAALAQTLSPALNSRLMTLELDKQRFTTNNATLSEGNIKLQSKISASDLFSTPQFNAQVILNRLNPKSVAQRFAITLPAMADKNALTKLSAEIKAQGNLNNIVVPQLLLTLDDTTINGKAASQLQSGHSSLHLNVDNINLDRYLPKPEKVSATAKEKTTAKDSADATLIPLALLHLFNVDADLKVAQLQIKNTRWSKVYLKAHSNSGLIQLNPVNMHGYNADIKSAFTIQAKSNTALISAKVDMQDLHAGKLLKDFMAIDKIKGQASLNTNITTKGLNVSDFKKHLQGKLNLKLTDATIKGIDLEHQQKVLEAKIKKQTEPKAPANAETKIASLSASAIINNGILNNNDLRAATPLSRIIGQGSVDLVKESINYVTSIKLTNSTKINSTTSFEKMNSIPLDVHISGKFDNLMIKVDFQKALNQLLQKELKKQEKKLKEQLQREIEKQKRELKKKEQEIKEKAQREVERKKQELKQKEQAAKEKLKKDAEKELEKQLGDKLKNLLKF